MTKFKYCTLLTTVYADLVFDHVLNEINNLK